MRWLLIVIVVVLVVFGGGYLILKVFAPDNEFRIISPNSNIKMNISSPSFASNAEIPIKYTCDGDDVNPAFEFSDIPNGAQSLVLVVHDPDAPKSGGWTHWILWNIDPETRRIEEDSVPEEAVEGTTDFGSSGWGGPCPQSGTHHYNFTLYALGTKLDLNPSASKQDLEEAMQGHVLEEAKFTGLYSQEQ